jgi:glycosyltransferase involved in cell wall biosynthesis
LKSKHIKLLIIDHDAHIHLYKSVSHIIEYYDDVTFFTPYHLRKSMFLDLLLGIKENTKKKIIRRNTGSHNLKRIITPHSFIFALSKFSYRKPKIKRAIELFYSYCFFAAVHRFLKRTKPNVIYATKFTKKILDYANLHKIKTVLDIQGESKEIIFKRLQKIEENYTHHSLMIENARNTILTRSGKSKFSLDNIDFFLVSSLNSYRSLTFLGINEDRIFRCPYAIDKEIFHEPKAIKDKIEILFVGRIEYLKGVKFLFDALDEEMKLWFNLQVVGALVDNVFLSDLKEFIWHGRVTNEEVGSLLEKVHYIILPSLIEGMSYSILEAMSKGVPPIISDCTGYEDIIEDSINGFIFESGNMDSFKNALIRVINSIDSYKEISFNVKNTADQFNWLNYKTTLISNLDVILSRDKK